MLQKMTRAISKLIFTAFGFLFSKKQSKLGVSVKKRKYDLPLESNASNKFIKMLVTLMTILLVLALMASFALSSVSNKWSSGLQGKATIEIPVKDNNGALLDVSTFEKQKADILALLNEQLTINEVNALTPDEINALIEPWLGSALQSQNALLPGVISVNYYANNETLDLKALENDITAIAPQARLDTHQSWLSDILKLTGMLKLCAYIIVLIIGATTIIAIAGAIRTRISTYREDLELLHLMGAGDRYIARQFQKHSFFLSLKGSVIGLIVTMILLLLMRWGLSFNNIALMPDLSVSHVQIVFILCVPLIISVIAMFTARITLLRHLHKMP